MANKAINRAFLKDALQSYNERIDDAVVGAQPTDIIGEDNAETGAKKGIQTLTVVDNSDTTIAAADREKLLTIVPAINELDREIGDADLTVVDNSDPTVAPADRPILPILTDAINELDRKQGDADLTVIDTTAETPETVAKDNVSDAINVLDKEVGDMATSTVVDTTADPAETDPKMVVVEALNVLDKEMGDMATSTVVDTLAADYDPAAPVTKKVAIEAINVLDAEMGELIDNKVTDTVNGKTEPEKTVIDSLNVLDTDLGDVNTLTVIDTTADPAKADPEKEAVAAINVLDREIGDCATITIIDTTADPAKTAPEIEVVASLNVLDKEIGDCATIKVTDTVASKTDPEKEVVAALNVLDTDLGDVNTLTVKLEDGTLTKEAVAAINRLDEMQGDDVLTVIDTIEGKTEAEKVITTAINVLDKELGENKDIISEINKKETIVAALNSIFKQSMLAIEEVPIDPADPDYSKIEHRYVFKQNFPAGTDPEVPTNILQTIDIEKPKFVKEVTTFRYEGDPVIIDPQTQQELVLHHLYMKLVIENQEDPIYLDIDHLITDFIVEDTEHIDLTLETREEAGERIRVVSADIVPNSLEYTEFTASVNRELKFTGFDHDKEVGSPEHYELCTDSTYGALLVVTGNPAPGQVSLADVQALNEQAGWGQHITVGDYVLHKDEVIPGDPQLTTTAQNLREAVNELDEKQGDDALTTTAQDLSAAINELNITKTVTVTPTAEPLPAGVAKSYDINQALADGTVDKKGTIEIPYSNYDGEDTATIDIDVDSTDGHRVIKADVIDGSIGRTQLDEAVNAELDFLDKPTELTTTEKGSVTKAINEVNLMKDVTVEEQAAPGPGVAKAFDIKQKDATGADVVKGTIEIPFSNYTGVDSDTVHTEVDNTDGVRTITSSVIDHSIDHLQLTEEINTTLAYVGDKTAKLSDKDTLTEAVNDNILALKTKMSYRATVSYLDFVASYMNTAAKNDMYVISTDFTVDGKPYNAGSWALCTEAPDTGAPTWKYINNGGQGTVIKPITNENEISEVRDAEGKIIVTDVIGSANVNDPAGSIYMISTAGIVKFAPHHGIYVKTAESGGTEVVEIFDFGVEGGNITYVGSEGANIKVTVDVVGTTGTIASSIVLGSLSKPLMDAEINAILNFTGYPTSLTTSAQTLAGGINEHDAELGDIDNTLPEIKNGNAQNVAQALEAIAFNNMTWEGVLNTTATTSSFADLSPIKRGYVYKVIGANCTVEGLDIKTGDWLICEADTTAGEEPSFQKLGSASGGGAEDGGPLKIFV